LRLKDISAKGISHLALLSFADLVVVNRQLAGREACATDFCCWSRI
jgi:hypothetical protein